VRVEDSFEDFADVRLDAAGQNLYVSRDGKVRTIQVLDRLAADPATDPLAALFPSDSR